MNHDKHNKPKKERSCDKKIMIKRARNGDIEKERKKEEERHTIVS